MKAFRPTKHRGLELVVMDVTGTGKTTQRIFCTHDTPLTPYEAKRRGGLFQHTREKARRNG